jgi:hypothetical protein
LSFFESGSHDPIKHYACRDAKFPGKRGGSRETGISSNLPVAPN